MFTEWLTAVSFVMYTATSSNWIWQIARCHSSRQGCFPLRSISDTSIRLKVGLLRTRLCCVTVVCIKQMQSVFREIKKFNRNLYTTICCTTYMQTEYILQYTYISRLPLFMILPPKTFDAGCILSLSVSVKRSQQAMTWNTCEHRISKTNEGNFTQFWLQVYLGS